MARLVQPAPKFVPPEWTISNQMKYANAEGERAAAERLVEESKRVVTDTYDITFKTQRDVNKKLEQRLADIKYWEKEVNDKLDELKKELEALLAYKTRVDKAIESLKEPLHIAQQCLINRQRRRGIDLVHDDPEKELLKEVEVIQGALALLHRTRDQAVEQIRLNRKAIYNLEQELKDKFTARAIDEHNSELKNHTANPTINAQYARIDTNSSAPEEWEDFSHTNINAAERQRQNSAALRSIIDGILQAVANDVNKQRETVDIAMTARIAETRDAKDKLEDHLRKVQQQITEVDDNVDRLIKAISDKDEPFRLSHTRLENRSCRPNIELCRDNVQYRLVEEVHIIGQSVEQLKLRLAQSYDSLKALERRKLDLEEDINIKNNTLFIDETECMGMRKSLKTQAY